MSRPFVKPCSLTIAAMFLVVSLVGGCRSVQSAAYAPDSASPSQPQAVARPSAPVSDIPAALPSRWPTRWGNNPDKPGTIIELDPADPLRPIHLSRFHQFRSTDIEYSDANRLAADIGITTGFRFKPEGPGSFLFLPNPKEDESAPGSTKGTGKHPKSDLPDLAFKYVSATPISELSDSAESDEDYVELQRTWFTYRDPNKDASSTDPVGIIILLPGLFGTPDPIVDALETYWRHRGYGVLRMRSQPSRFTEHTRIEVRPGQEHTAAILAATINDDRVAEGAYAVKAALDHLLESRPDLESKPTILVGMSGGAMMLPTVYAYAPDRYRAAVLIAGGADFLTIAIESNYKDWIDAIVFDFKPDTDEPRFGVDMGEPTKEQLATLSQVYIQHSKLDAYHTATEMTGIPVLMLHASFDKAVPASTGELLYRQLGQPERWTYPLSHELIFAGLPTQVARIDKWLTKELGIGQ